jgi:ATP-dependent Clp protease ATP-binding subunit ClpC
MFERFTERARQVVVLAQEEARALKHNYIGTEHILLGVLREEEGLGCRALESYDFTVEQVRDFVAKNIGVGDEAHDGQIPFTPRGKKVFELALREALSLGHNYIGTEHILLGLIREHEGVGMRALLEISEQEDIADKLRNEIIRMLSGPGGKQVVREAAEEIGRAARAGIGWAVTIGGISIAEFHRRPEYTVRDGGVVQISGGPGEPVIFRRADTNIVIQQKEK